MSTVSDSALDLAKDRLHKAKDVVLIVPPFGGQNHFSLPGGAYWTKPLAERVYDW
jgi:hypothetical protein